MSALAALLGRILGLLGIWRAFRNRRTPAALPTEVDPTEREIPADRAAELLAALLLLAAGGFAFAFVVLYVVYPNTPLLGATAGLALVCLAAALMFSSLRVVPQVTEVEERDQLLREDVAEEVAQDLRSGVEGISRRGLLVGAAGVCGCGLGAMAIAPAASLGPRIRRTLASSAWEDGKLVVDANDRPIGVDELQVGSFTTGFPAGADKEDLGSPVVIVRVHPHELHLSAARADWAPEGILAYSQICTHAGCAVTEFRYPLYEPTASGGPALVCPCHYSTFDVTRGAKVTFGPAGRPLPQLPLRIDADGNLRAAGRFSDLPGPAWFGVGKRHA